VPVLGLLEQHDADPVEPPVADDALHPRCRPSAA
jgi:hypothetical protein